MKPYGIIYLHTNTINGKVYVGKTIQKEARRYRNGNGYKNCVYFQAAIDKYGWEAFDHEVLAFANDAEELKSLEEKFIKDLKANIPETGYNIKGISEGHEYLTSEIKDKISQAQLSYNQKLRDAGIVKIAPNRKEYKIIDSIEHKHCNWKDHWVPKTEFNKHKSRWDGLNNYCAVCQREQRKEQYQKHEAINNLNENELKQSYEDRRLALSIGQKRFYKNNPEALKNAGNHSKKSIIRIDPNTGDIKVYESGVSVKADGFDNTYVSQVCNGKKKDYKGYIWKFK